MTAYLSVVCEGCGFFDQLYLVSVLKLLLQLQPVLGLGRVVHVAHTVALLPVILVLEQRLGLSQLLLLHYPVVKHCYARQAHPLHLRNPSPT